MNRTDLLKLVGSAGAGIFITSCSGNGAADLLSDRTAEDSSQLIGRQSSPALVNRLPNGANVQFFVPKTGSRLHTDTSTAISLKSANLVNPAVYQAGGRDVYKVIQIYNLEIGLSNGTTLYLYFDGSTLIVPVSGGFSVWRSNLVVGTDNNVYFNLVKAQDCSQATLEPYLTGDLAIKRPLSVTCNLVGLASSAAALATIKVLTGVASAAIIDASGSILSKVGTACGVELGPAGMVAGALIGQELGQTLAAATLGSLANNAKGAAAVVGAIAAGVCDDVLAKAPIVMKDPTGTNVDPGIWPDPAASTIAVGDLGGQQFGTSASCCYPIPQ